jgi:proteasome lid subunit RPN8/RPN11
MWGMGLKLSRQHRQQLLDWAKEAGDHECCGLLLGRDSEVERVELATNVAEDSKSHFEIDPSALIFAEKSARIGGPEILGYFHAHPNGRASPSVIDALSAVADGRCWLIIATGEITAWRPVSEGEGQPVIFEAEGLVWG